MIAAPASANRQTAGAPASQAPEGGARESFRERLYRQPGEELVPARIARREQQAAEAARVVEPQAASRVEHEVEVIVRERRRSGVEDAQAAGHPEMQDQRSGIRPDEQVLGAAAHGTDACAGEPRRQRPRDAPAQAPFPHLERADPPADEPGLDAPARRLYLRQLRHPMRPGLRTGF